MARNSITLNGNSSDEIVGLIIQELPPITKPAVRTEVETIDGRDGDITTKLGYSAYDKEISIGLYGNYEINEIIAFFNSEGTVTFSNEEDKFYRYQIFEQIDFERLVRFRTATVKLHVQPFKFSLNEMARTFDVDQLASQSIRITNNGNIYSRPQITLVGTGTINLSINNEQLLVVDLGETENSITIDTELMEAYYGTPDALANRAVDGDYDNLKLNIGGNQISWSGNLNTIIINNYSRWV